MPKYMTDTEHRILRKLLAVARHHGFTPKWVDDGGDEPELMTEDDEVVETVDSVQFSALHLSRPDGARTTVTLILGNGTDFVSDYTYTAEHEELIERVMDEVQGYAESLGN